MTTEREWLGNDGPPKPKRERWKFVGVKTALGLDFRWRHFYVWRRESDGLKYAWDTRDYAVAASSGPGPFLRSALSPDFRRATLDLWPEVKR